MSLTAKSVVNILIEYNSNCLEENEEEEKESINIELIELKVSPVNFDMIFTLDGKMHKEKTRNTLLRLTSLRAYSSKLIRKLKNNWGIV